MSPKILFVCIGNSCRSPMAEAVLKHKIKIVQLPLLNYNDWEIDSAGLYNFNVGRSPEPRCLQILAENNLQSDHIGRTIQKNDFYHFDYIFGMDMRNIYELEELKPKDSRAIIDLFGNYNSNQEDKIISDPYFDSGTDGFRKTYTQIDNCCENFVKEYNK